MGFTKRSCSCLLHGSSFADRTGYSPFNPRNTLSCLSGCRSVSSTAPCRKECGELVFGAQSPLPPSSSEEGCSPLPDQEPTVPLQPDRARGHGLEEALPWFTRWDFGSRQIWALEICSVSSRPWACRQAHPLQAQCQS